MRSYSDSTFCAEQLEERRLLTGTIEWTVTEAFHSDGTPSYISAGKTLNGDYSAPFVLDPRYLSNGWSQPKESDLSMATFHVEAQSEDGLILRLLAGVSAPGSRTFTIDRTRSSANLLEAEGESSFGLSSMYRSNGSIVLNEVTLDHVSGVFNFKVADTPYFFGPTVSGRFEYDLERRSPTATGPSLQAFHKAGESWGAELPAFNTLAGVDKIRASATFSDQRWIFDGGIDLATIRSADAVLTGPVFRSTGRLVSTDALVFGNDRFAPGRAQVIYEFDAPGGVFDSSDNGEYRFSFENLGVRDTGGNAAVQLPRANDVPDFIVAISDPDFTVAIDTFDHKEQGYLGGERAKLALSVANNGTLRYRGPLNFDVRLSTDAAVDDSDIVVLDRGVSVAVAPGQVLRKTFTFKIPTALTPGSYQLIVQADTTNEILDEVAVLIAPASVQINPSFVDLRLSPVAAIPDALTARRRMRLPLSLTNDGTIAARGVATVTITLVDESSAPSAVLTRTIKLKLAAHKSKSIALIVPKLMAPAGSYQLQIDLNWKGLAPDLEFDNNRVIMERFMISNP